jgi:hypothetical protein
MTTSEWKPEVAVRPASERERVNLDVVAANELAPQLLGVAGEPRLRRHRGRHVESHLHR